MLYVFPSPPSLLFVLPGRRVERKANKTSPQPSSRDNFIPLRSSTLPILHHSRSLLPTHPRPISPNNRHVKKAASKQASRAPPSLLIQPRPRQHDTERRRKQMTQYTQREKETKKQRKKYKRKTIDESREEGYSFALWCAQRTHAHAQRILLCIIITSSSWCRCALGGLIALAAHDLACTHTHRHRANNHHHVHTHARAVHPHTHKPCPNMGINGFVAVSEWVPLMPLLPPFLLLLRGVSLPLSLSLNRCHRTPISPPGRSSAPLPLHSHAACPGKWCLDGESEGRDEVGMGLAAVFVGVPSSSCGCSTRSVAHLPDPQFYYPFFLFTHSLHCPPTHTHPHTPTPTPC